MPTFKLAVEDRVLVNIKGKFAPSSTGHALNMDFYLAMDRLSQEEINKAQASNEPIVDFLKRITHGWKEQRLVLEDSGTKTPAAFSPEAFDAMLSIAGMSVWIYQAYLSGVGVQAKN